MYVSIWSNYFGHLSFQCWESSFFFDFLCLFGCYLIGFGNYFLLLFWCTGCLEQQNIARNPFCLLVSFCELDLIIDLGPAPWRRGPGVSASLARSGDLSPLVSTFELLFSSPYVACCSAYFFSSSYAAGSSWGFWDSCTWAVYFYGLPAFCLSRLASSRSSAVGARPLGLAPFSSFFIIPSWSGFSAPSLAVSGRVGLCA